VAETESESERGGSVVEVFGATAVGGPGVRLRAARLALWAVAATLVLEPLARAAEQTPGRERALGTLLLVVALGLVAARALPQPVSRRTSLLAAPVAISLLMLSLPVRTMLRPGRAGIVPVLVVLLVLLGCFVARRQRVGGALVGVAAVLQPTVLLFAPLLHFTGRSRAAATAGVTFAACAVLARAVMPHASYTYWAHHTAGVGGPADDLANQSLHGALLRLGATGPPETALFLVLGAAVAALGVRRAVRYARDGQLLLAVAITGCAATVVSPTAWQYQLPWLLLAVVGRVGRRASDRCLWPVTVVLVMTLPGTAILPNVAALHPLRENVVLIAALAAATAVPFLSRTSTYYRSPVPTDRATPVPARFGHVRLVPVLRRVQTRPNLLLELLLIRVAYAAYAHVRLVATGGRERAEEHGREILGLERSLHLDVERAVNQAVMRTDWLRGFFDVYYTSFHFAVPAAVLGVLYWRRPVDYRWARAALGLGTLLALLGFWLYPLAPPRLMPGFGIVDTVHGVQDFAEPDYGTFTALTNQYAAMPSLHFGWALWCGAVIVVIAPKVWTKALGLLHPLFTASAIVATGNHWVLDAAGGALVVGAGFGLTYVLQGPRARSRLRPWSRPLTAAPRLTDRLTDPRLTAAQPAREDRAEARPDRPDSPARDDEGEPVKDGGPG
jgi:hypothetical protein